MFVVGKILKPFGLKGEVRVKDLSDFDRFSKGKTVYVNLDNEEIKLEVESARPHQTILLVKFKGINSIEKIRPYSGLMVHSYEKGELQDDEFHYEDLIGLEVVIDETKVVGIVSAIIEVPQGHLLEVKLNDSDKPKLIPFRNEFVGKINEAQLHVHNYEGILWELILSQYFQKCLKHF